MRVISFVFCMFYFVFYISSIYVFCKKYFLIVTSVYYLQSRKQFKIASNQVHEEKVVENSEIKY